MPMTLSGTTGIVQPTAGAPAFSAYLTGSQSVSNAVWTKAQINTEVFDTNSNFDNTSNYRFTPTVAGYYQVNGSIYLNYTGSAGTRIGVSIYKNGAGIAENQITNAGGSLYGTLVNSALIYLNGSTDYVELYGYFNSATAQFLSGQNYTYFQAAMIRSA